MDANEYCLILISEKAGLFNCDSLLWLDVINTTKLISIIIIDHLLMVCLLFCHLLPKKSGAERKLAEIETKVTTITVKQQPQR